MNDALTTFRPAPTTAQERMNVPTECGCCGRDGLKLTVKMAGPRGIVWMGTGCAAKAMGVGVDVYKRFARDVQSEADAAERRARDAADKAAYDRMTAFLTRTVGAGDRFSQLQRIGGLGRARQLLAAEGA